MKSEFYFQEIHPKLQPLQSILCYQTEAAGPCRFGLFSGYDCQSQAVKFYQPEQDLKLPLSGVVVLEIVNPLKVQLLCLALQQLRAKVSDFALLLAAVTALNQLG